MWDDDAHVRIKRHKPKQTHHIMPRAQSDTFIPHYHTRNWLNQHDQVQCLQSEQWNLIWGKPHLHVKRLYLGLPEGSQYVRGYKCPADITGFHVLEYYRRYWPRTKLIIGIRHPVRWFESLYNYRTSKYTPAENATNATSSVTNFLPLPNRLIGLCSKGRYNTCTEKGNYALDLLRLGKTNQLWPLSASVEALQEEIVGHYRRMWFNVSAQEPVPNPVYLLDTDQLGDTNATRVQRFQESLQDFLGLSSALPKIPHSKPGKEWNDETPAWKRKLRIDICEDQYRPVRQELMRISRLNSRWMREVFLDSPGVYSAREHLEEILQGWMVDPCDEGSPGAAIAADVSAPNATSASTSLSTYHTQPESKRVGSNLHLSTEDVTRMVGESGGSSYAANGNAQWPAFDHYVDSYGNITGDVQFLLDFAIIGFGKCGTTAMLDWLKGHPQTQCIESEVWDMVLGHPEAVVSKLYNLPPGRQYKRGYKSPREIVDSRVLRYHRTYFPATKLFVGIRSPIPWFESLYNFRVQNLSVKKTDSMPHPNALMGVCTRGMKNTCTEKGNFGLHLLRLGKQNVGGLRPSTERAERILGLYKRKWFNATEVPPMENSVFLFDVAQLGDTNETRSQLFRRDVQEYLGLDGELPPLAQNKPGKVWGPVVQAKKDKVRIRICDDEYAPLRQNLLTIARLNADYIRREFLDYPGVHYSSREYLDELLEGWMHDPCQGTPNATATVAAS